MKLVLLVVLAIAIFPTDSRGFPDKPDKRNFAVYHNDKNFHDGSGSNHSSTDGDLAIYTASLLFPNGSQGLNFSEVVQQSLEERKEGYDEPLRATCNDRWWCRNKNLCNQWWYNKWCQKSCNLCTDNRETKYIAYPNPKLSWSSAYTKCQSLNSRLAILTDPIKTHALLKDKFSGYNFWLGATDSGPFQEGRWRWYVATPFPANFPWGPHQPDNDAGNEDCLEWGHGNNFNDADCNIKKGFMCEGKVPHCPSPWVLVGNECFLVVTEFYTGQRNWAKARTYCQGKGGDLAIPHNRLVLVNYLKRVYGRRGVYYLGGSDLGSEGNWQWVNGDTIDRTHGWSSGEPNNCCGGEDCLIIYPERGADTFNDVDCARKRPFICERN